MSVLAIAGILVEADLRLPIVIFALGLNSVQVVIYALVQGVILAFMVASVAVLFDSTICTVFNEADLTWLTFTTASLLATLNALKDRTPFEIHESDEHE